MVRGVWWCRPCDVPWTSEHDREYHNDDMEASVVEDAESSVHGESEEEQVVGEEEAKEDEVEGDGDVEVEGEVEGDGDVEGEVEAEGDGEVEGDVEAAEEEAKAEEEAVDDESDMEIVPSYHLDRAIRKLKRAIRADKATYQRGIAYRRFRRNTALLKNLLGEDSDTDASMSE